MAQKKVGELIKEARTKKGLSQEKLAGMVEGLSASELSKAERNEKDLTQEELKAIAKICGVTQKSLLEAAGYVTAAKTTAAKKPAASGKTTAQKTSSSTSGKTSSSAAGKTSSSAAGKTSSSTAGKTASASTSVKLTATEKKFLELYRAADSTARKNAEAVLKGTKQVQEEGGGLVSGLLGGALETLLGKK